MALRSQNFITEPLSRLEMNDIVRQVDFINRADVDNSGHNLTWLGPVRGRGRSGLELLENKTGGQVRPGTLAVWSLLASLLYY